MAQPQDTVPLSDLVFTATHSVHHGLLQLSERLGQNLTDLQRREYLLQYIAQARTLLGRLLALSRWSAARMPEVQRASDALAELDRRQIGMRKMADELFFLHEALPAACAPPYDVRAAVDVLGSGRYSQLPRTIETAVPGYRKPPPTEAETLAALDWLRGELRARRAHWRLPAGARLREARGCVVCTLPGTPQTLDFCGEAEFRAMKPGSVFISCGRGLAVDEDALAAALSDGHIFAAMDVFKTEPLPKTSPLWDVPFDRLLLTAHNADLTSDYFELGWDVWEANLRGGFLGDDAYSTVVDKAAGY